jgi:hypothetical protein
MFKQKPFLFSFLILGILIALHTVGSYLYWYWKYSGFDNLVHIFSGMWIALLILWLALVLGQIKNLKEYKVKSFLIAFIAAILFGVIWELIENFSNITSVNSKGYALDTAMDILSDGIGGALAYLYVIRRRKSESEIHNLLPMVYDQAKLMIIKN